MCQTAGMESYWITEICGKICFTIMFFILGEISTSMKFFIIAGSYIWSISVHARLVTPVGRRIVGIKLFFSTVFKYSFLLSFKSNLIKSKSPVSMLSLMDLLFSIFDKDFSKCSVNSLTLPFG